VQVLLEAEGLPELDLPEELRERYGGPLGFAEPRLVANFVSTLDGVVAIQGHVPGGGETDRFVMGLLRACADVVLLGSGTLQAWPRLLWTPDRVFPAAADGFAELRRRLGKPPAPELAVLTATGSLNVDHPALEAGAVVLTTEEGAARLRGSLPAASSVVELAGRGAVDPRAAVQALRERGHSLILSEAGPHVFGSLLAAGLVDELFLTLAPLLAGRALEQRLALVEGVELPPLAARLLSARRDGGHLFLRYALE
jgi:riboflavin biosynthesis pyrimidine reductase